MISYNNDKLFTVLFIKEKDSNSWNFNNVSDKDDKIKSLKNFSIWSILIIALMIFSCIIFKLFTENSNSQNSIAILDKYYSTI